MLRELLVEVASSTALVGVVPLFPLPQWANLLCRSLSNVRFFSNIALELLAILEGLKLFSADPMRALVVEVALLSVVRILNHEIPTSHRGGFNFCESIEIGD
ncbi:unnamed protein product [Citrullus colocynthis]|uniref:Uncharacterized protein n=1 Tax=Citrullus colocynthis TaxID=252529 RepID=A0ABP0XM96_9ROSI